MKCFEIYGEKMNEKKIAFITAVSNDVQYDECQYYINRLGKPEDYIIEKIAIRNATSLCSAYNQAMKQTDAKYKIYLHQDVLIRNMNFIFDLLNIFEDESIGLVGMVGGTDMPQNGICFATFNTGSVDAREPGISYWMREKHYTGGRDVIAVDGLLMATQVDIKWREDLFKGFHYYDISQSFEMIRAGYRVYVPDQKKPWVIHHCNFANLIQYEKMAEILKAEYSDFLTLEGTGRPSENYEQLHFISEQLVKLINPMIKEGQWDEISTIIEQYKAVNFEDNKLEIIALICEIYNREKKACGESIFVHGEDMESLFEKYRKCVYGIIKFELDMPQEDNKWFVERIVSGEISVEAIIVFLIKIAVERKIVFDKICKIYLVSEKLEDLQKMLSLKDIIERSQMAYGYTIY